MAKKQQQKRNVRKTTGKIADPRAVRFGSGSISPSLRKAHDPLTYDSRAVRFGSGSIAPSLRK